MRLIDFKPSSLKWVTLAKMLASLFVMAHLLACMFWICGCDSIGAPMPQSWIDAQGLREETRVMPCYITALYVPGH